MSQGRRDQRLSVREDADRRRREDTGRKRSAVGHKAFAIRMRRWPTDNHKQIYVTV
jgi:hypothetical protein